MLLLLDVVCFGFVRYVLQLLCARFRKFRIRLRYQVQYVLLQLRSHVLTNTRTEPAQCGIVLRALVANPRDCYPVQELLRNRILDHSLGVSMSPFPKRLFPKPRQLTNWNRDVVVGKVLAEQIVCVTL